MMRSWLAIPLLLSATASHAAAEEISLFNGRDLTGWEAMLASFRDDRRQQGDGDIWSVKDGAILCSGGSGINGWLHTTESYTNFVLTLEYRWGQIDPAVLAAGRNIYNSGIFFRSNPRADPGRVVPFYYQAQIINTPARSSGESGGGTGDMWIVSYDHPQFSGARENPDQMSFGNRARPSGTVPPRMYPMLRFAEKPIGEWNVYEIRADGDKLTYTLNGEVVNRGSGAAAVPGKIGLECENTPIMFRDIKVKTID